MATREMETRQTMNSRKLLVVDDEEPIRSMLFDVFTRAGYEVLLADSAEAAIEMLRRHRVNVMFLDLKLPGQNGVQLCKRIREYNPIACIYAMTAHTSLFELSDCREAGFDDYFIKPIEASVFLDTAEQAFDKIERWSQKR